MSAMGVYMFLENEKAQIFFKAETASLPHSLKMIGRKAK
jgi:hypothetical protein